MTAPKPIQIFKPGRHTAMSGAVLEFSAADLAACAAAYDPARHEAPIVVGHPRTDAPAYGWVGGLAATGDGLEAAPHQVDPAFADMVAAGRFKKISASFFTPDSTSNPVPGVYYLRHVGFLGAQPPAVKGLRAPEFSESGAGVVEFASWEDSVMPRVLRQLREWLLVKFGAADADQVVPNFDVEAAQAQVDADALEDQAAPDVEAAPVLPAFSEPPTQGDAMSAEDHARLESLEAENKRLKDEATARARQARHAEHAAFADGLRQEGRLTPANRDLAVAILDHLADAPAEFGEGDGKQPMLDAYKAALAAAPKAIEFGEVAADKTPHARDVVDFAADDWAAAIDAYVLEHKSSTAQAVDAIRAGWRAPR